MENLMSRVASVAVYCVEAFNMRMFVVIPALVLGTLLPGFRGDAPACDMNVREAGFINNAGGPYFARSYMLWFFTDKIDDEAKAYHKGMYDLVYKEMPGINISLEMIESEKVKPGDRTTLAGIGVDLKEVPVAVLSRQAGWEFQVMMVVKKRLEKEDIEGMVSSPKKMEMKKLLSDNDNYCVLIFAPGADEKANQEALKEINAAITEHAQYRPSQKMPLMTLDRKDKAEDLFVKELGIKGEDTEPLAAVVFGKARVLLPAFKGAEIRKDGIAGHFAMLNHNASDCTPDAVDVPGMTADLLFHWEPKLDEKMILAIAKSGAVPDLDPSMWTDATIDPQTGEVVGGRSEEAEPRPAPATDEQETPEEEVRPPAAETIPDAEDRPGEPPPEAPAETRVAEAEPGPAVPEPAGEREFSIEKAAPGIPAKPSGRHSGGAPVWLYAVPAVAGALAVALVAGWLMIRRKEEK